MSSKPGPAPSGDDEHYSEEETVARREAALKRMLSTPHKPHKPPSPTSGKPRGRPPKPKAAKGKA
jgi:hypothetical protein